MPSSVPPTPPRTPWLRYLGAGLLMGSADIVPGVSGGTMALIVGVYERLVASIGAGFSGVLALVRFDGARAREAFGNVAWTLLLPLAAGIITAILIGARFIPALLEQYPVQSRGLFFGLIAASLAVPWLRMDVRNGRMVLLAVVAAGAAFGLAGLPAQSVDAPSLLVVLCAAAVAICAMILPGVSGAYLLLIMGLYEPTLRAIDTRDLAYVATFAIGAGLGLGSFSKVISWLLKHHHDRTMAVLVGLMAGSLRALWPWQTESRMLLWPEAGDPVVPVILLGLVGFAGVALLTWWGHAQIARAAARVPGSTPQV